MFSRALCVSFGSRSIRALPALTKQPRRLRPRGVAIADALRVQLQATIFGAGPGKDAQGLRRWALFEHLVLVSGRSTGRGRRTRSLFSLSKQIEILARRDRRSSFGGRRGSPYAPSNRKIGSPQSSARRLAPLVQTADDPRPARNFGAPRGGRTPSRFFVCTPLSPVRHRASGMARPYAPCR
jgi:hypothetical protein